MEKMNQISFHRSRRRQYKSVNLINWPNSCCLLPGSFDIEIVSKLELQNKIVIFTVRGEPIIRVVMCSSVEYNFHFIKSEAAFTKVSIQL